MSLERILCIRRSDVEDNAFVLVKVTSSGPRPLDVQLVGTEGHNPYLATVKHSSVRKLRASNYQGTDHDWETLLKHALHQQEDADPAAATTLLDGVETVASVGDHDGRLTLTLRKNISGITQRLGSVQLTQADEQEIELFDWTGLAALRALDVQQQLSSLRAELREQQAMVARLTAQLDDLVTAKHEHEQDLLHKFTELLNAKKLKIRNQQRLLSGAKAGHAARASPPDVHAGASSAKGKRKARGSAPQPEHSESDGFEPAAADAMDVDVKDEEDNGQDGEEPGSALQTPEQTDSGNDDGDDDGDNDLDAAFSEANAAHALPSSSPALEASNTLRSSHTAPEETGQEPPPKRELPFTRHNLRNKPAPAAAPADDDDDDDDETDDDEL